MRVFALLVAAGCAVSPPPAAEETTFAQRLLARGAVPERAAPAAPPTEPAPHVPAPTEADEIRGLLDPAEVARLRPVAADEAALAALLGGDVSRETLAALAYLRSPAVAAARARVDAARTGYAQSDDLADLVRIYRAFARSTDARLGPEHSRVATERIAPSPNVDALSGEVVRRTVAITFEELRAAVRDTVAAAERAHADAARLAAARTIVGAEVELQEGLVKVVRTRFEAGNADQAALFAFQARLETLRTDLAVLEQEAAPVRARWNRLLDRDDAAPLALGVAPAPPEPAPGVHDEAAVVALARAERQEMRSATLGAERAAVAVRLAETMTLPRMDLGGARLEHERAPDTFPEPGRMQMPRYDFGVREAQVAEMRARQQAMDRMRAATRRRTEAEVRDALFVLDAAARRYAVHARDVVPLAERALESARGTYAGGGGYLDLLDAERRLLAARLGLVDARRAHAHARARLLETVGVRPGEASK